MVPEDPRSDVVRPVGRTCFKSGTLHDDFSIERGRIPGAPIRSHTAQ
jgi:hypothetical protein